MKHITFDMHQLVADIMVLLSHSIGKSIVVDKKLEADLATIVGDRSQIEEAMLNIAINSRDAMPAGGAITFVTKNVTPSQEFLFAHGYTGMTESFLLVSISDTGFGMDSATLSRVCEPFFTTKGLGKGTGLGMASVYGTIKVHGGIIDIQSTKDIGTIVSIYFPIGSSASTAPAPLPPPPVEKKTRGTLLVIDDEHFVRDICKELLEGSGYKVSTCSSGFEALAYYQLHHTEIQLVIIDMIMPQMNGFQTLAEFKKINPSVKAILSTGYHLEDATRKVLDAGFMRIINKPFSAQDLDKAVSDAMAVLTVNK